MTRINGLYGVTVDNDPQIILKVTRVLEGGARVIQYRNKTRKQDSRLIAEQIAKLCRHFNAIFIINDDIDLALAVDADGVHLGKNDPDVFVAREKIGDKIIGVSCYNDLSLAIKAEQQGADYVAFGRFFPSMTKPDAVAADISLLISAKEKLSLPIVAIGGITTDNAKKLIDSGADAIAVINGLFEQEDVNRTAKQFVNLFRNS